MFQLLALLALSAPHTPSCGVWIDSAASQNQPEHGDYIRMQDGQPDHMAYWLLNPDGTATGYLFNEYYASYRRPIDAEVALTEVVDAQKCAGWGR